MFVQYSDPGRPVRISDIVGRAKWDAWEKLKGTEGDAARQQYIDLIESLRG